uniref:Uncharacterized protein n=1 Tax=Ciona intestinalis TaxID=7719 RepID=H2XMP5_CIOIN
MYVKNNTVHYMTTRDTRFLQQHITRQIGIHRNCSIVQ